MDKNISDEEYRQIMYERWDEEMKSCKPIGDWSDLYEFTDKVLREKGLK